MTVAERIARLWIGHWPEPATGFDLPAATTPRAFTMQTCMRRLVMTTDARIARELAGLRPPEIFTGLSAYQFLIEVTTGLRSAIPGETNVFGQFKRAWEAYRSRAEADAAASLAAIVAQAIRDTRAIRHQHLQDIGGASYGALARRLLQPRDGERVLFIGAGDLSRSMLPFFRSVEIGAWSRRLPGPAFAAAGRLFTPAEGARAAGWAHHVIMTTPADPANDARWKEFLEASLVQTVLHLGRRHTNPWRGPAHALTYDLDDLIDLRRSQDNIRSLHMERARLACQEHARLAATLARAGQRRTATG